MADKQFRVLLDLTELHIEAFKYVWISISPRHTKTITDFKTSLRLKINLGSEDIKLFVRDGLLLDDETIFVLKEEDTVKVQYVRQFCSSFQDRAACSSKELKKFSKKRDLDECNQEVELSHSKTCKKNCKYAVFNQGEMREEEKSSKKKNKKKKLNVSAFHGGEICSINFDDDSKKKNEKHGPPDDAMSLTDNSLQDFDTFETASPSIKKIRKVSCEVRPNVESADSVKSKTKQKDLGMCSNVKRKVESSQDMLRKVDTETTAASNLSLKNNCPKKKRKRRRKSKKVVESAVTVADDYVDMDSEFKSFMDVDDTFTKRKHTVFSSPTHSSVEHESAEAVISSDDSELITLDTYVVGDSLKMDDQPKAGFPKMSTPAQSNGCSNPSWRVSVMKNEESKFSSHKTNSPRTGFCKSKLDELDLEIDDFSNEEKFENFPALKSLPEIGAHIAYKIIELDESYSPIVSNFREGIVKYVNSETGEMEVEFLKHEIKPGRTGKFENLKEDEVPLPEVKRFDTVIWSSLIEPKLLSS